MNKYLIRQMKELEEQLKLLEKEEDEMYQMNLGKINYYQRIIGGMSDYMGTLFAATCEYDRTLHLGINEVWEEALQIYRRTHESFVHLLLVLEERIKVENVKEKISTNGINLKEASKKIGISDKELDDIIERKEICMDADLMRKIAEVLEVSLADIV